jgi:hypothetical protein
VKTTVENWQFKEPTNTLMVPYSSQFVIREKETVEVADHAPVMGMPVAFDMKSKNAHVSVKHDDKVLVDGVKRDFKVNDYRHTSHTAEDAHGGDFTSTTVTAEMNFPAGEKIEWTTTYKFQLVRYEFHLVFGLFAHRLLTLNWFHCDSQ